MKHPNNSPASCEQVHILGVGLAVHEKLVHPEMRPLHKKLVDQFHMMRTGLHHVRILLIICVHSIAAGGAGCSKFTVD